MGRNAKPDQLEGTSRARDCRNRRRGRHDCRRAAGRRMKRKPLPKAITRSIANLHEIAVGFAADEQGRVPRQPMTRDATPFDAVEPEPRMDIPAAASETVVPAANRTPSE